MEISKLLNFHFYGNYSNSHHIEDLTDRIIQVTRTRVQSYDTRDHLFSNVDFLGASNPFEAPYHRLGEIYSSHHHNHNNRVTVYDDGISLVHKEIRFSREEGMGRYVDLHQHRYRYINFTGPLDPGLQMQEMRKGRKTIYGILGTTSNYSKLYILIMFVVIL